MGNQNSSRPPVTATSGLANPSSSTQIAEESKEAGLAVDYFDKSVESNQANNQPAEGLDEKIGESEAGNGQPSEWNPDSNFDSADLVGLLFNEDNDNEGTSTSRTSIVGIPVENEELEELQPNVEEKNVQGQRETLTPKHALPPTLSHKKNEKKKKKGKKASVKYFTAWEVRIGKVIGEGGFGRILQGGLHGMPVAIKFFHAPLPTTTKLKAEVDSLMKLKHKNIVEVYGLVEQLDSIDCPQVVLQYFPEGNVLQYLSRKENPDDIGTLGKISLDVIEGCQYLRSQNIVHGNLAARNILIEKIVGRQNTYYNAKISDMGLIRFAEATGANYVKLPGTDRVVPLRWVPKEIIDGDGSGDYTFASDVWGFGVFLWEIWTRGAIPYGASYSNMRVIQFLKDGYSPLKVHRPTDCPGQVVFIMENIFKVNPDERPSFNALHQLFLCFKGFGLENKVKSQFPGKANSQSGTGINECSTESTMTPVEGAGAVTRSSDSNPKQASQDDQDFKDKVAKKKKNKTKKEKLPGPGPAATGSGPVGRTVPYEGAGAYYPHGSGRSVRTDPPPVYSERYRQPSVGPSNPGRIDQPSSDETTVAALLMRVNQLERERNERRRGGPATRRGVVASPHFTGGYHVPPRMQPPLSPPLSSPAPPPYTEEPLPDHSSSAFTPPARTPTYEYNADRPGTSHGHHHHHQERVSRSGRGGRDIGSGRLPFGREDYLRKVRQLAEEIEVLRAEKMTQELLKKSAELADLMKQMAVVVTEETVPRYSEHRPTRNHRPFQEYDYHYPPETQHGWQEDPPVYERGQDFSMPHNHNQNRTVHQNFQHQPSSRRPYYGKGPGRGRGFIKRGRGGNSGRGGAGGSMDFGSSGNGQQI